MPSQNALLRPVESAEAKPMHETTDWRDQIFNVPPTQTAHRKKSYDVFSAKAGQERRSVILSARVLRCNCHFAENASKPCLNTPGCPWCNERWPKREKGYLCGLNLFNGRLVLIELTTGAWESCPTLLNHSSPLRGSVIRLTRRGKANNSPVCASLEPMPSRMKEGDLPPAWDLRAALFTLWEVEDGKQLARQDEEEWDGSEPQAPAGQRRASPPYGEDDGR